MKRILDLLFALVTKTFVWILVAVLFVAGAGTALACAVTGLSPPQLVSMIVVATGSTQMILFGAIFCLILAGVLAMFLGGLTDPVMRLKRPLLASRTSHLNSTTTYAYRHGATIPRLFGGKDGPMPLISCVG